MKTINWVQAFLMLVFFMIGNVNAQPHWDLSRCGYTGIHIQFNSNHGDDHINDYAIEQQQIVNEGIEKYNQRIALYNKVIGAINEMRTLLGQDFRYYEYYASFLQKLSLHARNYKAVINSLSTDRKRCEKLLAKADDCDKKRFSNYFWDEESFLKTHNHYFELLQTTLEYVRTHEEEEKLNLRKIALYAQAVEIVQAIDATIGSKYFFINKDFQQAKNIVVDMDKNGNYDQYTKETVDRTFQSAQKDFFLNI